MGSDKAALQRSLRAEGPSKSSCEALGQVASNLEDRSSWQKSLSLPLCCFRPI